MAVYPCHVVVCGIGTNTDMLFVCMYVYIDADMFSRNLKRPLFTVIRFFHASCLLETNVFYNACKREMVSDSGYVHACTHTCRLTEQVGAEMNERKCAGAMSVCVYAGCGRWSGTRRVVRNGARPVPVECCFRKQARIHFPPIVHPLPLLTFSHTTLCTQYPSLATKDNSLPRPTFAVYSITSWIVRRRRFPLPSASEGLSALEVEPRRRTRSRSRSRSMAP
jgi:hypothetical protein